MYTNRVTPAAEYTTPFFFPDKKSEKISEHYTERKPTRDDVCIPIKTPPNVRKPPTDNAPIDTMNAWKKISITFRLRVSYTEDTLRFCYEIGSLQFTRTRAANTNIPPRTFQGKSIQTRRLRTYGHNFIDRTSQMSLEHETVLRDEKIGTQRTRDSIIIVMRSEITPFRLRRKRNRRVYRDFDLRTCIYRVSHGEIRQTRWLITDVFLI